MKFKKIVFFFAVTLFAIYLKAGTWNDLETEIIWYYSEDSNGNLEITKANNARGEVIVPSVICRFCRLSERQFIFVKDRGIDIFSNGVRTY